MSPALWLGAGRSTKPWGVSSLKVFCWSPHCCGVELEPASVFIGLWLPSQASAPILLSRLAEVTVRLSEAVAAEPHKVPCLPGLGVITVTAVSALTSCHAAFSGTKVWYVDLRFYGEKQRVTELDVSTSYFLALYSSLFIKTKFEYFFLFYLP